jgi:TonB family protein
MNKYQSLPLIFIIFLLYACSTQQIILDVSKTTAYIASDTLGFVRDTIASRQVLNKHYGRLTSNSDSIAYEKDPIALNRVNPVYPTQCLENGIEGDVYVKIWITSDDRVVYAKIIASTNSLFNEEALRAGLKWKFKAPILDGKPIGIWCSIPFRFRLPK